MTVHRIPRIAANPRRCRSRTFRQPTLTCSRSGTLRSRNAESTLSLPASVRTAANHCMPKNKGIEQARGDYIAYLDDDNEWRPNHLQVCVEGIESNFSNRHGLHPDVLPR